jgi:subtilisin-like proprotein convertase family protein
MRRRALTFALLFPLAAAAGLSAASAVSPADAPRATAGLLQTLSRGDEEIPVIVGIDDGIVSDPALLARQDPALENRRIALRLQAQQLLTDSMPADQFAPSQFYERFSMVAGTATRQGALALARRPDVKWVAVDGRKYKFQSSPQASQVLIKSDLTNTAGFTGAGRAVAVIDTGVDYTVAAMGGGTFPNSKVIGGTDIADKDSDPADCDGHGTEVSGVAAGPGGVAPGAKIVAIKVFSTTRQCDGAADSDILQGINYAITNKAQFGIAAINISLGSELEGTNAVGYCDDLDPGYVIAINQANAAGLPVVIASGNGARSNQIADPACVSPAVSAGAVYSSSFARVSWSPPDPCTDSPVSPDQIVCFSDSTSNLSLLAPGAFWTVTSKGGSTETNFAGTSASAPAVSGAMALVSQARPDLSAAGILTLLRATGKPITDGRNGVVTPRVDTLAAVQLAANKLSVYGGTAVAIPDATGSATVTTTTSGFTGSLGTIHVAVQIDHPDPSQLRLTLVGPDGTTVLLSDHTGTAEHPINAFYGLTDAPAQSLEAFAGKTANGVWTLRVEDTVVGVTGSIRGFAVQLVAAAAPCVAGPSALCLNSGRFKVQVAWQVPSQGTSGAGTAVPLTTDTGYFWFFSSNNVELVIKVVDGRAVNGKFWVFYGALSNVQYTITVTDSLTGDVRTYVNPDGNQASVADVSAF